jgi:hypothetical protein
MKVSELPSRIGHDQALLVGRQVQVVRLLAGGDALHFVTRGGVDHADRRVQRIEHEDRSRALRGRRRQRRPPQQRPQAEACAA